MKLSHKMRTGSALAAAILLATSCGGTAEDPPAESDAIGDDAVVASEDPPGGDDSKGAAKGGKTGTKKPSRSGSSKPAQGSGGGGGGGATGGGPTGNSGSGGDTKTRSQRARAASPAAAGTYTYDTDGQRRLSGGQSRQFPPETTLEVRDPQGERQYSIRDLRDSEGNGTVTETELVYTSDGVRLAYLKITSHFGSGLTDVREFRPDPPVMLAPTGAGPGDVIRFTLKGSGTTVRNVVRVGRAENVQVGGETVRTFLVTINSKFSGALQGEQKAITWVDPNNLLSVREHVTTHVRNGPVEVDSEYEAKLQSLDPR